MRLECENSDRLEQTEHFHVRYTGAEANAAIAMCSLGAENIHLLSAVPENPIGRSCLDALRKYGPDTAHVLRIPGDSRLGLFFLETGVSLRPSQVVYDRKYSAFAETPFDAYHVNALFRTFSAPGWLHLSGTLPALNECCRESAFQIIRAAKKANYTVSFDLNYRAALWSESDAQTCFRELVKDLASVFKTRIELRQIGVRDETKILGGIGICGRQLCCHAHLSEFVPVSIKMAKEQNLSLNPTKISGVCGRLMCCLKNEEETYEYLNSRLPNIGDTVTTIDGVRGEVQSVNVLRQLVKVIVEVNDEKELREYKVKELKFRPRRRKENLKLSAQELKELSALEDKGGKSKLDDAK